MPEIDDDLGQAGSDRSEARRLLAEARAAHRTVERARAKLEADRKALESRVLRFNQVQSDFNTTMATDRDRLRDSWAEFHARQKRLADEWDEVNRFHAEQAALLDVRAAALAVREKDDADARTRLQRELVELREEASALDARARNARLVVEELERQREQLRADVLAPPPEPPLDLKVALDRATDRDLAKWANELAKREDRLNVERASVTALFASVARDKAGINDQRRVLAEQFAQLAAARAGWQAAERATVLEMEQLARTLRHREAELDAREQRLNRADAHRRDEGYALWQLRLRLEAWQSKLVAFEMRWHTEREQLEAEFAKREDTLAVYEAQAHEGDDSGAVPYATWVPETTLPAIPAELSALRDEVERMAAVLLETDLPERPEPADAELPWGTEEVRGFVGSTIESGVALFDARAA
ncbi:hypothetical protein R5W23_003324 [Gemmata sp. JC673]|uniref:Chromosome partition protein Smc n=1 Tax=Gemmata algarum TaxID=2975278 RepID=A0ABU5F2V3_9BACT|nr:hypothetical protein [Gemmata algarum]MDY3561895.1 hypothetical protein [Gemmata algarum]